MKRTTIITVIIVILVFTTDNLKSQPIPPGHGEQQNQAGGEAPINSGLSILAISGILYSLYKKQNK